MAVAAQRPGSGSSARRVFRPGHQATDRSQC